MNYNLHQKYEELLATGVLDPLDALTNDEIRAVWAGDVDNLPDCSCCCSEHTFPHCRARLVGTCRSGLEYGDDGGYGHETRKAWAEHYGMTLKEFDGVAGDD